MMLSCSRYRRVPCLVVIAAALSGCAGEKLTCPFPEEDVRAPSAGCFSLSEDGLLLVQGLNGKVSLPGGASRQGESARCAAYRETWEETGLRLEPTELIAVFDTGFHLYSCRRTEQSGVIDPPMDYEVRAVFYLPPDQFDKHEWRFHSHKELLKAFVRR